MTFRAISLPAGSSVREPPNVARPVISWLPVAAMVIDETYQRPLEGNNWAAIRRIADAFSWAKFTPVLVAMIEGDRYAVIDGQHRVHAAMLCGIAEVPALVVEAGAAEQAEAFAAVNTQRMGVSTYAVYRAGLAAGDGLALMMHRAVHSAGCTLRMSNASTKDKKPGEIYCIGLIREFAMKDRAAKITLALSALRRAHISANAALYSDYVLRPWVEAVAARPGLTEDELVAFLQVRDVWKLLDRADRLKTDDPASAHIPLRQLRRDAILAVLPQGRRLAA